MDEHLAADGPSTRSSDRRPGHRRATAARRV